jgi:hypothetical protein
VALPIMYFSLPFSYVFTHGSACTEQNLSQRYQPAMVFFNVTHNQHSGTVVMTPLEVTIEHKLTKIK